MVFYEGERVGPSKVHVTISDPEESDEKMNITVNTRPDLEVSQNYGSKVLAENLPNTTSELNLLLKNLEFLLSTLLSL